MAKRKSRAGPPPDPHRTETDMPARWCIAAMGLAGVILVLLSTTRYGPGISPDSVNYIAAARSLLAGAGFKTFENTPFVSWPPLFPALMALLGLVGIKVIAAARFINALTFGLIVFAAGHLLLRSTTSRKLALVGTGSILLSYPLVFASVFAWTESLFALFVVLFLIFLSKFMAGRNPRDFVLLCVAAALACLQRYMGAAVVVTGAGLLLFAMRDESWLRRLRHAVVFGFASAAPVGIWVIRNYRLTHTLTGERVASPFPLRHNLNLAVNVVRTWFVSRSAVEWMAGAGTFLFAVALVVLLVFVLRRFRKRTGTAGIQVRNAAAFMVAYFLFLIVSSTTALFDPISDRLLAPIFVPVFFLALLGIEHLAVIIGSRPNRKKLVGWAVVGLCLLWLVYPFGRIAREFGNWTSNGAGGYNTTTWHDSQLLEWLRNNPLEGNIYSNGPDVMFALAEVPGKMSPRRNKDIRDFLRDMPRGTSHLVWFGRIGRSYLYQPDELARWFEIDRTAALPDGAVFLVKPRFRPPDAN